MVYAVILAGGVGSRMGGDKPKQYLTVRTAYHCLHDREIFLLFRISRRLSFSALSNGLNIQKILSKSTLPLQATRLPLSRAAIQETKLL